MTPMMTFLNTETKHDVRIARTNIANPPGLLCASANILKFFRSIRDEQRDFAYCAVIFYAVLNTIEHRQICPADLTGTSTTTEFVECIWKVILF